MRFSLFVFFVFSSAFGFGQNSGDILEGKVTYVTASSVYVRFSDTQGIHIGDSLKINKDGVQVPCLVVINKSSSSCICSVVNDCDVKKDDAITATFTPTIQQLDEQEENVPKKPVVAQKQPKNLKNMNGKIWISGLGNVSNIRDDSYRMNYGFSLNSAHINNSKFSIESYVNYTQYFSTSSTTETQKRDYLNVYNLSVKFDLDSSTTIILGRKINSKISSLGALDGLQVEKYFGQFYAGVVAGFRPDYYSFGFDPNLFQYGAYTGFTTQNSFTFTETTMGFLEQYNTQKLDRRFVYLQHSSRIGKNLNLFASTDLDIYSSFQSQELSNPRLTNLYLSARYKINKMVNFGLSYGSRKQVLFYETFPSVIEQILATDEAFQGVKVNVNVRPNKKMSTGLSYSKRFQNNSQNKSDNSNGYFSWYQLPQIGGNLTVNVNFNTSNFLRSNIISIRHSRPLFNQKVQADFYYRFVNYDYLTYDLTRNQNYFGTGLSYPIHKLLVASVLGEVAVRPEEQNYRFNFKIIRRF